MGMLNEINVFWGDSDLYMQKTIQSRKRSKKNFATGIGESEVYREILNVSLKMKGFAWETEGGHARFCQQ